MSVQPLPRWDDAATAGMSEAQLLLYRSNLLGSDLRITNYGGGNTSAKIRQPDPLTGEEVEVLWVKGSGGDIGSMKMDGFATLYLDKLHALKRRYRGLAHEDEMVAFFPHCTFNLNPRATSIDTPPHCFTPYRHIDHMHADALIAFAAAKNGEALIKKAFGDEIGWIPWMRPGFELGLRCEALCQANPDMKGLIFGSHGLVNWGDTSKECYQRTISIIERAAAWLDANGKAEPFGPQVVAPLPEAERRAFVAELAPLVRGMLSATTPKVMHYADGPAILEFVGSARGAELAAKGTTCPDHFLRTKILPLWVPFTPGQETAAQLAEKLGPLVERYATDYAAYYERCKRPDSPAMRDPMPVLLLVPGIGLLAFQKDKQTARVAAEYFVNTINVVRWAEGVDEYVPIPEQEAFDIEYWLLEEAKLQRLPKAEGARRQGRAHHRRRRRHRPGGGAAAARRGRARRAERSRPGGARRHVCRAGQGVRRRQGARRGLRRARRIVGGGVDGLRRGRVRRPRHPRLERRHRLGVADRSDHAADVADQHGHPRDRLLPGRPRRLRPAEAAGRSAARSSSSAARTRWSPRPAPPPTARPRPRRCTWPAAWRRKARRSASAPTSSTPTR